LIVNDISFTQRAGENIAIAGETGSGKTTLLKMIGGLVQPTSGEIRFENKKVIGPLDQLLPGNPGIAYASQHFELRNNYWVHEILEYANLLPAEEAQSLYDICRISHLFDRRTNDGLSGGEKQRIALARLLTTKPRLLLLDEPFSNLDIIHKNIIRSAIQDIGERLQTTCIMVSHDPLDILSWADTVFIMKEGQIIQSGIAAQVYRQPVNEYCAALLGDYNLVGGSNTAFFEALANVHPKEGQLFFRPESITVSDDKNGTLTGVIKKVLFYGSYTMLEILAAEQLLSVQTNHHHWATGDTVDLSFFEDEFWWL